MGSNLNAVAGKIRPELKEVAGTDIMNLSDFSGLRADMFEFLELDDEGVDVEGNVTIDIDIRYDVFSFLASVRGDIKPLPGHRQNAVATNNFLNWLYSSNPGPRVRSASKYMQGELDIHSVVDGHTKVIYPLDFLLAFDYNQVAEVHDEWFYNEEEEEVNTWKIHEEGKTYHELFGHFLIPFCQQAKEKGWEFVIFCFD